MPAALRPDVHDVATPHLIGTLDRELAVQPIRDIRPLNHGLSIGVRARLLADQAQLTHQRGAHRPDDVEDGGRSSKTPGAQGGPLMHVIAAKAVCFKEALEPGFKDYQAQVIRNAKAMAEVFIGRGYDVVSGGTDNHLMLISLVRQGLTGKEADAALGRVGITVNKNAVPNDPQSPFVTSGIRIGTPTAVLDEKFMAAQAILAFGVHILDHRLAILPAQLHGVFETLGNGIIEHRHISS